MEYLYKFWRPDEAQKNWWVSELESLLKSKLTFLADFINPIAHYRVVMGCVEPGNLVMVRGWEEPINGGGKDFRACRVFAETEVVCPQCHWRYPSEREGTKCPNLQCNGILKYDIEGKP